MKAIAGEAGLSPALVEEAARLIHRAELPGGHRLFGGPMKLRLEETVAGSLSDDDRALMVDAIRATTTHHGYVASEGAGLGWTTVGTLDQVYVSVIPERGGSRIVVSGNRIGAFALYYALSLMAWGLAAGATRGVIDPSSIAAGVGIVGVAATGAFATARLILARTGRSLRRRLQEILSTVTRIAAEADQEVDVDQS